MLPAALHSDKRTHANHSSPKSPAWLKTHLKIHGCICRNVLEEQPACWDSGFYFRLLFLLNQIVQQLGDQTGGINFLWRKKQQLVSRTVFFPTTSGLFISCCYTDPAEFSIFAPGVQFPWLLRSRMMNTDRVLQLEVILGSSRRGKITSADILVTVWLSTSPSSPRCG